jgi:hypothetical protein
MYPPDAKLMLTLSGTKFYSLLNEQIRKMNFWSPIVHLLEFTEEP